MLIQDKNMTNIVTAQKSRKAGDRRVGYVVVVTVVQNHSLINFCIFYTDKIVSDIF